ncbi:MAG: YtxH domain-containing protein [Terrimesophilobacter sp.]
MRGKLVLLVGVGIGYVLGARAGRERYEDIKMWASKLWNDPRVQHQVHEAEEFAKDKAPDVAKALADGTKKVVSRAKRNQRGTSSAASASRSTTVSSGSLTSTGGTEAPGAAQAHD